MANAIIELDMHAPLNQFFGSVPSYPAGTAYTAPAMRAIVFTDLCGSVAQTYALGDDGHMEMLQEHDAIVRSALTANDGREVKHTGDGIMAAFTAVSSAVAFAVEVQRAIAARNEDSTISLDVSIGISAGEPVTNANDDLFGAAVQLAARLCDKAAAREIAVSIAVKELSMGKRFSFEDRGAVVLKGLPEPAQMYAVIWHE